MKIVYFDIISGVSGNMILGSLLDAGLPALYLKEELLKLKLEFYDIKIEKQSKNHITGTLFKVNVNLEKQPHRKFSEIETLLNESDLSSAIREKSLSIFEKLAQAESKVHGIPVNLVHFHEVGAIDSIIDITGSVIGLDYFKPDRIHSAKVVNGHGGLISSSHGKLPNPAPATLEVLKGIPCENINIKEELTTPTGASILAMLVDEFSAPPDINISSIGYGCVRL
ncbi:DUF111 family protein [Candidatus Desantisbacteria bacterium]|nr:DUF111 family protein [Candidatus Desantisbacteria bacterium]